VPAWHPPLSMATTNSTPPRPPRGSSSKTRTTIRDENGIPNEQEASHMLPSPIRNWRPTFRAALGTGAQIVAAAGAEATSTSVPMTPRAEEPRQAKEGRQQCRGNDDRVAYRMHGSGGCWCGLQLPKSCEGGGVRVAEFDAAGRIHISDFAARAIDHCG